MKIIRADEFDHSRARVTLPDVSEIIEDVQKNGDRAVRRYAREFDEFVGDSFEVTNEQVDQAYSTVGEDFVSAIQFAASNIREFAVKQRQSLSDLEFSTDIGVFGHRLIPVDSVGCYVPGGRFPLPSTALMTVIPAKVAGVGHITVTTPRYNPHVVVAAHVAGADRILTVGGVQAIAALAYGTESIQKVSMIVGPGNKYVTSAKKYVYGDVGIDFIAGPSEVLIMGDETSDPDYIAADLLAQAEHDPDARAILLTTCRETAESTADAVTEMLARLRTRDVATQAIRSSAIVLCRSLEEMVELSNTIAPEHLELHIKEPRDVIPLLRNYGSLFIGKQSAEVFGDYCAGPNHTLPTSGAAHYTGGLSVLSFLKLVTFQQLTDPSSLITPSTLIAETEGLIGHRNAALIRTELAKGNSESL